MNQSSTITSDIIRFSFTKKLNIQSKNKIQTKKIRKFVTIASKSTRCAIAQKNFDFALNAIKKRSFFSILTRYTTSMSKNLILFFVLNFLKNKKTILDNFYIKTYFVMYQSKFENNSIRRHFS